MQDPRRAEPPNRPNPASRAEPAPPAPPARRAEPTAVEERVGSSGRPRSGPIVEARLLGAGFFAVQFFLGYEWLMSWLSKALAGDFAAGLSAALSDMAKGETGWYRTFLDRVAIPNGPVFGNLVMAGELLVGALLVATSLAGLAGWPLLGGRGRSVSLALAALAAIVGAFMSLNFHLASGAAAPWVVSSDPYDQGVDLDSLLTVVQLVVAAVTVGLLRSERGTARSVEPAPARRQSLGTAVPNATRAARTAG